MEKLIAKFLSRLWKLAFAIFCQSPNIFDDLLVALFTCFNDESTHGEYHGGCGTTVDTAGEAVGNY